MSEYNAYKRFMDKTRGTPTTTVKCQRCLQTGHWTYDCKAAEPKYQHRESRTKQLKRRQKQLTDHDQLDDKKKSKKIAKRQKSPSSDSGSSSSSSSSSSDSSSSSSDDSDADGEKNQDKGR